jgi:hypothetical protein
VKFDIFIDPEAKSDTGDKNAIEHLIKICIFIFHVLTATGNTPGNRMSRP